MDDLVESEGYNVYQQINDVHRTACYFKCNVYIFGGWLTFNASFRYAL